MILSIIIPIYNAQKYLTECLHSVASCPTNDIECILVIDGSTDSSVDICRKFAEKDSRFKIIEKENEGVSEARNTGIINSHGKYIFFLDADDFVDVKKWSKILTIIDEDKYDFVAFSYNTLYENGESVEERFDYIDDKSSDVNKIRRLLVATPSLNTCWGKLLKLDIIVNNKIKFNKQLKTGEDAVFILEYFGKAQNHLLINDSIVFYRQHENSVMHKIEIINKLKDFEYIYNIRKEFVHQWNDSSLRRDMYKESFSMLTDGFLKYANGNSLKTTVNVLNEAVKIEMVNEIIINTPYIKLKPFYKKRV